MMATRKYVKLKPIIDPKKTVHNMILMFVFNWYSMFIY